MFLCHESSIDRDVKKSLKITPCAWKKKSTSIKFKLEIFKNLLKLISFICCTPTIKINPFQITCSVLLADDEY